MYRCTICDCIDSENTTRVWFVVRDELRCEECQHAIEESLYDFSIIDSITDDIRVLEVESDDIYETDYSQKVKRITME